MTAPLSQAVSHGPRELEDPNDPPPNDLGGILYADEPHAPVPEQDWVRLVDSIAAGDQGALQALYERMHRLVFTLAMRISKSAETAEEITVDVFHDVWRRSPQYDAAGGSVVGWIMNQARSRAIDRLRFEQREKRVAPGPRLASRDDELAVTTEPTDTIDARERRRLLEHALTTLTRDERQAIETAFFSELTYAEAATRLKQPLGTVKTRVRSGLAKLRKALSGEGKRS